MNSYFEQTGDFQCRNDAEHVFIVLEYTKFSEYTLLSGEISRVAGLKDFQTTYGQSLNLRDDGTFETVSTGEILRRI